MKNVKIVLILKLVYTMLNLVVTNWSENLQFKSRSLVLSLYG